MEKKREFQRILLVHSDSINANLFVLIGVQDNRYDVEFHSHNSAQ